MTADEAYKQEARAWKFRDLTTLIDRYEDQLLEIPNPNCMLISEIRGNQIYLDSEGENAVRNCLAAQVQRMLENKKLERDKL